MPHHQTTIASRLASALPPRTRQVLGLLCLLAVLVVLAAAWTIPFRFESTSILYKFGISQKLLRGAKVVGLTAAVLAFLQVVLASRLLFLDRIFALDRIYRLHRLNGIVIASLIPTHGLLNIAAEKFVLFPLQWRYWPEFLGIGMAIFFLTFIAGALWRPFFRLPYNTWARLHHVSALIGLILLTTHILFVSDSFRSGPPRWLILSLAGLTLILFGRLWLRRLLPRRFVVSAVRPAGRDATLIEFKPRAGAIFPYLPGQFAFIKPRSGELAREEHPFTLASAPTHPDSLQCIIRASGDWTGTVSRMQKGDEIAVDGPYGLFSYLAAPAGRPLVLIAGGIGITPMLSMLRTLADCGDTRPVLLVWSNRTPDRIVLPEEFAELEKRLAGLRVVRHFTRQNGGRLDEAQLEKYLADMPRESAVFLCGPEAMMRDMARSLKNIGFSAATIYREVFRL